eukprot:TRINITY_DN3200_c0_g2_i2.p1 TRINITY_DN3200_c0_g2~~TRINITY_DN3200_c0_g2_i2.p1  ORF type:complete len:681 (-),score=189.66 TRINITY_DN3200_c0_g2_i2:1898-3940(-)
MEQNRLELKVKASPHLEWNESKGKSTNESLHDLMISVDPPKNSSDEKISRDIICVVDISGSMGSEVYSKDALERKESHGLTILNLVVHAVKTVAATLESTDRLAVVTFSDDAKIQFPLQFMEENTREELSKILDAIRPDDRTNIWDGLKTGLDMLKNLQKEDYKRMGSVILLTDGQPTVRPKDGELVSLNRWVDSNEGKLPGIINVFGFGYTIDSVLLSEISNIAGGSYCFVPDATILGTAFVNCIANLKCTVAHRVSVHLEPLNGAKLDEENLPKCLRSVKDGAGGIIVDLSTVQFGQSRDLVVPFFIPDTSKPYVSVKLDYHNGFSRFEIFVEGNGIEKGETALLHRFRQETVEYLDEVVAGSTKINAKEFSKKYATALKDNEHAQGIVKDLNGQVSEAQNANAMKKWGRHFLPSLAKAHLYQQCNNFKDPGVQFYGGSEFSTIRDTTEDIFVKLPPPKATPSYYDSKPSYSGSQSPAPFMSSYMNAYGGCFHGKCIVQMGDDTEKRVEQVKRGDILWTNSGRCRVECVLKTEYRKGSARLVSFSNGLILTPYHPILLDGKWIFPIELKEEETIECSAVYTFLMEGEVTSVKINGIECITLAHGIEGDRVASHEFFGTNRVKRAMESCNGWNQGLVSLVPEDFLRDSNGKVCGLRTELKTSCAENHSVEIVRVPVLAL